MNKSNEAATESQRVEGNINELNAAQTEPGRAETALLKNEAFLEEQSSISMEDDEDRGGHLHPIGEMREAVGDDAGLVFDRPGGWSESSSDLEDFIAVADSKPFADEE